MSTSRVSPFILSRVKRQGLVGSLLCGFNELNVLTESEEAVNSLFSKVWLLDLVNKVPIAYRSSSRLSVPTSDPSEIGR